jgi:PAS domain S-box-containing protein
VSTVAEPAGDIRSALAAGELRVDYLPIVDLGGGRVGGVEALLRWEQRPGHPLPPMAFLAAAEQAGELVDIGHWVLRSALEEVAALPGDRLRVSVNLSLGELLDPGLPDAVEQALLGSGHPPSLLYLELSERSMSGDVGEVAAAMHRLKALGVRLSVDDFGVGMASLAQLQQLPVDEVKVDRSFVARMHDDPTSAALVRTVVSLARSLRMTTLAEGVETETQERMLLGLRCTAAQGWLYALPHRRAADAVAAVDADGLRRRANASAAALWSNIGSVAVASRIVESAFDHAPVGMALIDGTGTQLAVNPALCHLLGAPADVLVGHSCWDAVHPDDLPADQARMDAVLRGDTPGYAVEERYIDTTGQVHWVEVTVGGAPEETSGVPGELRLVRQVRSIDDRRRAEERRVQLAAVVDASADAIVVVGPDGLVSHFNPAAEALLGWTAAEVVGQTSEPAQLMLRAGSRGEPVRLPRTRIHDRHGTPIPVDVTLSPFRTSSEDEASIVAVVRDIREQVAAEAELREANERLRAFAHRLSHDLQQPITALGGFLHLLQGAVEDGDAGDWVVAANRSQRRLVEAVDALLRTAVGAKPAPVPVDVAALLAEVETDLAPELAEARATVSCDELPAVLGDVGLLRRVLVNLVANSCRYRDPDRPLWIHVGVRPASRGRCTLLVDDDGLGFDGGELDAIFEEGTRGAAAEGRLGSGTGLAIARDAVSALDGLVWAEHRPGGGARVCITLPLA